MKIKLVFSDWQLRGKSVYNTEKGIQLSLGQFHSGTTFNGEIILDEDDEEELKQALKDGYEPVFCVYSEWSGVI